MSDRDHHSSQLCRPPGQHLRDFGVQAAEIDGHDLDSFFHRKLSKIEWRSSQACIIVRDFEPL